jgi:beta-phosphoglucomutase-like phosphatase (HAD superfamily)
MKSQLKALIFDVDGTLAETERDGHRVAFNQAFLSAQLNWHWDVDLYGELLEVAGGKERIKYYLETYQSNFNQADDGEGLDQFIADLHQRKTRYYTQLLRSQPIALRLGVKRLIREAKSLNIRLAIATTAAYPNAISLLENSLDPEAISWFEVIAAGDIVKNKKPAPDIYLYVLEKMGLAPQECVVFEDSAHGLMASSQAGIKTIVTVNDYTKHQDFTQAYCVLNHLGEPEQPLTTLAGQNLTGTYINVEILEELMSKNGEDFGINNEGLL